VEDKYETIWKAAWPLIYTYLHPHAACREYLPTFGSFWATCCMENIPYMEHWGLTWYSSPEVWSPTIPHHAYFEAETWVEETRIYR
jgi:hypothetical protein